MSVRSRLPVEEPQTLIVEASAGVIVDHVRDHRDPMEMAEVDERLELVDLPGELSRCERREALRGQQPVHVRQIRRKLACRHRIVHLRREKVGAVVAEAVLALIFLKRQRHDGIHAKVREIFDALHHIQDLADPMRADVFAGRILRVERSDVKLIDDQVVESRRTEVCVMPLVARRIAHDAVAVRIPVELELARIRIALEALAAGADHVEPIEVAVLDARHEAGPKAIGVLHQQIAGVLGKSRCGSGARLQRDVDLARCRRPGPERGSAGDEVRAERRIRRDVQLGCRHRQSSACPLR